MSEDADFFKNNDNTFNLSLAVDMIIYMLPSVIKALSVSRGDEVLTKEGFMKLTNDVLEQWEQRIIKREEILRKENTSQLVGLHDDWDELSDDCVEILMQVHTLDFVTARKEFKRYIRHSIRKMIENA